MKYTLELWVCNQSERGADSDYTDDHLSAAGADDITERRGVTLSGQTISSNSRRQIWAAYLEIRKAVEDTAGDADWVPSLTAMLPGADALSSALQQAVSFDAKTYTEWARRSRIE